MLSGQETGGGFGKATVQPIAPVDRSSRQRPRPREKMRSVPAKAKLQRRELAEEAVWQIKNDDDVAEGSLMRRNWAQKRKNLSGRETWSRPIRSACWKKKEEGKKRKEKAPLTSRPSCRALLLNVWNDRKRPRLRCLQNEGSGFHNEGDSFGWVKYPNIQVNEGGLKSLRSNLNESVSVGSSGLLEALCGHSENSSTLAATELKHGNFFRTNSHSCSVRKQTTAAEVSWIVAKSAGCHPQC